ncbi:lamin tail domain-containing protein [Luteolibacter soli]|uniref:Lamin tail domain-containing protein n=1 Tax=Luteolibacter soli TaxID=3135280 RepID=A0ABU9AWF9_9BACT
MNSLPALALLLACVLPSTASAGLLAHWKLDSSTADEVASYPATWEGTAAYSNTVASPHSTAAATLSSSWLKAGTGINFDRDQSFSATAWIKGGAQDSTIVGDMVEDELHRGWEMHVGSSANGANSDSVTVWLSNDYPAIALQVNAALPVLDQQWHHVAFTYDGSSTAAGVKIYIDGVAVPVTTSLDTLGSSIANGTQAELNIGSRNNGAAHNFTGDLDEVAIFDHALTATEMTGLFQGGVESITWPVITATTPQAGQTVDTLVSADVTFSFPVSGVGASDLLINGTIANGLQVIDSKHYRFAFPAPSQGPVNFTWAAAHGITGLNGTPAQPAPWSATFSSLLPTPEVIISEFLTRNAGGQEDEDHDTPDWIELLNPGTAAVDLAGWALTDDPALPRRWVLPSVILQPGQRRVIFASGKDRRNPAANLHTDFKLGDDGGYLALSNPAGILAHVFDGYPPQEGNVSFGLNASNKPSDGRAGWRYFLPTPGTASSTIYSAGSIAGMSWTPQIPTVGQPITVTVRVTPDVVVSGTPTLSYVVMHGSVQTVPLSDNGLNGDVTANDSTWTAVIPAGATTGQMVRWRALLVSAGGASRWPVNTNANQPLPLYEGTVVGGEPTGQTLPVYQLFVPDYVFPTTTTQTGIDSDGGARGAFFGGGKLYDNVLIRIKGTTSRYLFKRSHRVDFNPGRDFQWSPDLPAQRELNLNSEYNDPSYLRQFHQLWMHRDSGNAGAPHFPVQLRMNGATWQLAFHTYSADSELVEELGLDPRGALYKQVGTLDSGAGAEKKARRWESNADYTAFKAGISSSASLTSRLQYIHDNTNLPAVINYLAVTRIAQEADDVWANMVLYRDSDGTREWRPIPFDLNLSFGQLFYAGEAPNTVVQATNDANKSHPLYGTSQCLPNTGLTTSWNRLYEAVIRNDSTRNMLLRRMRTLMDRYLATSAANSSLETSFNTMGALIDPYATADRAQWGWPPNSGAYGLGPNISPSSGLATLKTSFLAARRTHLYTTHSINNASKTLGIGNNNKAGIPDSQAAAPTVNFGVIEAHSANADQEYIQLVNPSAAVAVDISDWTLTGASGSFTLKGGTVISPAGSIYISPNVLAFRSRTVSPKAGETRFVVGPYSGHLSPYGEKLVLKNAAGTTIAQTNVAADPAAPPVAIKVTEILSSSAHTTGTINGDWWELTNTAATPIDLSGFSWDDNHNVSAQAVFPAFVLAAGESIVILDEDDEDEAALFRVAWNLPASVRILTREDFHLPDGFQGLGNGDSVIVYIPSGTETARANYLAHQAGKSRAWFRNGDAVPGGYSQLGKYGAVLSSPNPGDLGSPGFAAADPATLTAPYDIWAASHDLWSTEALATADPDGDGRNNRIEYLFGGDPRLRDLAPAQTMTRSGTELRWTFTRRNNDPSLTFELQGSANLVTWTPASLTLVQQVAHPTLADHVLVTYRVTPGTGAMFYRVKCD